jgi:hypothetical protein
LPDEEAEPPQPHLFTILMRDHEESPSRMYDNLDDLTIADYDVDELFPKMVAVIVIESLSLGLKFRNKYTSLGIV